jgi:ankyrin repeat protein
MAFAEQEMTRLRDSLGCPPLHYTYVVYDEIAELLIAKGADVNAKNDDGGTPLDLAIENKQTEIADLLRKHGGKTGNELKAQER